MLRHCVQVVAAVSGNPQTPLADASVRAAIVLDRVALLAPWKGFHRRQIIVSPQRQSSKVETIDGYTDWHESGMGMDELGMRAGNACGTFDWCPKAQRYRSCSA